MASPWLWGVREGRGGKGAEVNHVDAAGGGSSTPMPYRSSSHQAGEEGRVEAVEQDAIHVHHGVRLPRRERIPALSPRGAAVDYHLDLRHGREARWGEELGLIVIPSR
jgi:hypothetical protein